MSGDGIRRLLNYTSRLKILDNVGTWLVRSYFSIQSSLASAGGAGTSRGNHEQNKTGDVSSSSVLLLLLPRLKTMGHNGKKSAYKVQNRLPNMQVRTAMIINIHCKQPKLGTPH
jgi:hypothetical protein